MRYLLMLALVLVAGAYLAGCSAHSSGALALDGERKIVQGQNTDATLVDTKEERALRLSMMEDIQSRQAQDDWDYLWLVDKSSTLSQWHASTKR